MGLNDEDDIPLPDRDDDPYDISGMSPPQKQQFMKMQEFAILTDEHNKKIEVLDDDMPEPPEWFHPALDMNDDNNLRFE